MKGDYVIARSFGDAPLIRRVWETGDKVVYICTEERYNQMRQGNTELMPVGFPKEDIFEYDEGVISELDTDTRIWRKLKPWRDRENNDS